ncbi:DNA mismatch repair protein MutS [Erythrobacter litoralis]|uniref:Smr/MutS family protein n=1 Tax=Erythrobacter litoralis TaxID=39960 RepID=UPI002435A64C|nr:Smr/MutS family protein [Erythrobacter litoralis]MDG6080169.1 DNA mismatch repair protein MutS [Erythrobacter litoralis]
MTAPRGLSEEEAAAWDKLAATVTPLVPVTKPPKALPKVSVAPPAPIKKPAVSVPKPRRTVAHTPPTSVQRGLDSHWERRMKAGSVEPDFTLDLHGHGLDAAYNRLMSGVAQARAMDARTILLIAGKSRPVDPADRGTRRGAIRAKVLDWLAASSHSSAIAAIRKAHRRHGGEGALYIILKRGR